MKKITFLILSALCGIGANAQFYENFDGASVSAPTSNDWVLPTGTWKILSTAGTSSWTLNDASHPSNTLPNAAFLPSETLTEGQTSMDVLVSPLTPFPNNATLLFNAKHTADAGLSVFVLPATANIDDPATFSGITIFDPTNYPTGVYNNRTLHIGGTGNTSGYIVFKRSYTQTSGFTPGEILIDDIALVSDCWTPDANVFTLGPAGNGAVLSWPATYAGQYEVHVVQAGTTFDPNLGTTIIANGNSVGLTGTTQPSAQPIVPNTSYYVYVRGVCESSASNWVQIGPFYRHLPECGSMFYDDGGPASTYLPNANTTFTICPTNPGDMVSAYFQEFNTEVGFDALYVFDGPSTAAPMIASMYGVGNVPGGLPGGYWGNTIPGPFTSSSPDGCLTFHFRSDGTNNLGGWKAEISCGPPVSCIHPVLSSPIVTDTSVLLDWQTFDFATSWEVIALPCGSPAPGFGPVAGAVTVDTHPYEITDLQETTCYDFYVRSLCGVPGDGGQSSWSSPISATTGENSGAIVLKPFVDTNNNGTFDTGESISHFGNFLVSNSGNDSTMWSSSGVVLLSTPGITVNITYQLLSEYASYLTLVNPSYSNLTVDNTLQTYYFPVQVVQPLTNMSVALVASNAPRPNMVYNNYVMVSNYGTATQTATLDFTKDPVLGTLSSNQPITLTPTGFTKSVTLAPNQTSLIDIDMQVPDVPVVNMDDVITTSAALTGVTNSLSSDFLSFTHTMNVVNSYDPNDIAESHGPQIDIDEFSDADYLYYTVRFQNTGNAEAINISIENTLDDQLDAESLRMVGASHTYQMTRTGNDLTFRFDGINLTWQSQNDESSQGWLTYRIKVDPGFEVGDVIPNVANIYFDTNPAIVTNTFETQFVEQLELPESDANQLLIWPNPATDKLQIRLDASAGFNKVEIYDIVGKKVGENTLESGAATLDISALPSGLYLVKARSFQGGTLSKKLIVE
ncbi:T9SS type A sorting domain-containing protein [Flavobacterium sp. MAH-1]|uniref:T9SS type A sorting domain-containing protein n=1 Tax=Flavobacterium agri TaxID=2743471 RepID=A0A7Y9C4X8_9FLAO|nr:T9SS type A sorting domain-containing protein [Flavobacterium agri]NUY80687.1 T9SS type A sorting domain-containing protein [Flavobacterium agri]NYA70711.1 T9SS type A sorting domain-containing protein [Flavobacterium agri]